MTRRRPSDADRLPQVANSKSHEQFPPLEYIAVAAFERAPINETSVTRFAWKRIDEQAGVALKTTRDRTNIIGHPESSKDRSLKDNQGPRAACKDKRRL